MTKYLIGIDEVGRGPIAGPVSVCALVVFDRKDLLPFKAIKDSKKLSEKQREEWFKKIKEFKADGKVDYCVCSRSNKVIDKVGIAQAIRECLASALQSLELKCDDCTVLLDGGLKAPLDYKYQKTIIKGDEKEKVISMASVCAKVTRDRLMVRMANKYSGYGLEIHKGYGTKNHYSAIGRLGQSTIHRKSFLRKLDK